MIWRLKKTMQAGKDNAIQQRVTIGRNVGSPKPNHHPSKKKKKKKKKTKRKTKNSKKFSTFYTNCTKAVGLNQGWGRAE